MVLRALRWGAAAALLAAAGCADTATVSIVNGGTETASFDVKRPIKRDGTVLLRLERSGKLFQDWLRIEIPTWPDSENDILFATLEVKAEYRRDWENGRLERASEVVDATVHVLRSSGLAGSNYHFTCAITFAKVYDESGKDLGRRKYEVAIEAPLKEK